MDTTYAPHTTRPEIPGVEYAWPARTGEWDLHHYATPLPTDPAVPVLSTEWERVGAWGTRGYLRNRMDGVVDLYADGTIRHTVEVGEGRVFLLHTPGRGWTLDTAEEYAGPLEELAALATLAHYGPAGVAAAAAAVLAHPHTEAEVWEAHTYG